jgi:hypothetical protein
MEVLYNDPHIDQFLEIMDALYDYIPVEPDSPEFQKFKEDAVRKLNLCYMTFEHSIFYVYKRIFMHLSFYETYREYNFGSIPIINFNYIFKKVDQEPIRYYTMLNIIYPSFKNKIVNNMKNINDIIRDQSLSSMLQGLDIQ